jgi:hypothetical protein
MFLGEALVGDSPESNFIRPERQYSLNIIL